MRRDATAGATANGTRHRGRASSGRLDARRSHARIRSASRTRRIESAFERLRHDRPGRDDEHAVANDDCGQPAEAARGSRSPKRCGRHGSSRAPRSPRASATRCGSSLRDQEHAGIDIVTDGEQTRRHFVTTFIEGLDGVDFEHKKTVRIRNRYDADVPVVVGPGRAPAPGLRRRCRASCAAQTARQVKYTLPGPMTMVDTLYDAHYGSREKLAWAFAEILNEEARAIAAAGVDVIQFDEPAFNVYFDEVRDWGVAALERAARGSRLHDGGAHLLRLWHQGEHRLEEDARQRMAAVRADVSAAWRASKIDQVSLECANSHVPIDLIGLLEGKDVLVGAIDVATDRVETPEEVAATSSAPRCGSSRPTACCPAPIAGWCRCRGTSPAASWGRWGRAPRWSGAN